MITALDGTCRTDSTTICVDANDHVHICYLSFDSEYNEIGLKYATNADGDWHTETADPGGAGYHCSMAIDSNGKAHLSYIQGHGSGFKYATNKDGSWQSQLIDTTAHWTTSIAIDPENNAHIVYPKEIPGVSDAYGLGYSNETNGVWTTQLLDAGYIGFFGASLKISSTGVENIACVGGVGGSHSYLRFLTDESGSWEKTIIDDNGHLQLTSMVLDSTESPSIFYYDSVNATIKCAVRGISGWSTSVVCEDEGRSSNGFLSSAIDSEDNLYLISTGRAEYITNKYQTEPQSQLFTVTPTVNPDDITLNWGYPYGYDSSSIHEFQIYRGTSPGNEGVCGSVQGSQLTFTDTGLASTSAKYYYLVIAMGASGQVAQSLEVGPLNFGMGTGTATSTSLTLRTNADSTALGLRITLAGQLTQLDQSLPGLEVVLYYSNTHGSSWNEITSVTTDSDGNYSAQWIPSATGDYIIEAIWNGNSAHPSAATQISFGVTSGSDKYTFTVESSSTMSNLLFDSKSSALSFQVSGPTGTAGYTKIMISKDLVKDGSGIHLTLDGTQMEYTLTSTDTYWILYFTYHHSSHSVVANLGANDIVGDTPWSLLLVVPVIAVGALASFVWLRRKRKT
jgi:hypothetical protein